MINRTSIHVTILPKNTTIKTEEKTFAIKHSNDKEKGGEPQLGASGAESVQESREIILSLILVIVPEFRQGLQHGLYALHVRRIVVT